MPSQTATNPHEQPIRVLIAGAGLGGLMLAMLLERINVNYTVFERAPFVKPLGSALSINANILPVFEQLGMIDEICRLAGPCPIMDVYNAFVKGAEADHVAAIEFKGYRRITGYDNNVMARYDVYDLMLSKIPSHKIFFSKRIQTTENIYAEQDDDDDDDNNNKTTSTGVRITCTDGSSYEGDILVGADGAYSAVRHNLYKEVAAKGLLPKPDGQELEVGYVVMVGKTGPLDPEKYPVLKEERKMFSNTIGSKTLTWTAITIKGNRICWGLYTQVDAATRLNEQKKRNSEWRPDSLNEETIETFRHLTCPFGGTMGDLIDTTPKDIISRVYLEQKMFETWYHGRTVLLGDACHKMLPSAGQGAVNAMQDAVMLANAIYELGASDQAVATPAASPYEPTTTKGLTYSPPTSERITAAFEEYRAHRFPEAKHLYEYSQFVSRLVHGQTWFERLMRKVVFSYLPESVSTRGFEVKASYRPQAAFLPLAEVHGTGFVRSQKASRRYAEELLRQEEENPGRYQGPVAI